MLYESEYIDTLTVVRELLSSIRDTNRRIFEIKNMIQKGYIKEEKISEVKGRYLRLKETRSCLIYSIYDMRQKFIESLSGEYTKESISQKFKLNGLFRDLSNI